MNAMLLSPEILAERERCAAACGLLAQIATRNAASEKPEIQTFLRGFATGARECAVTIRSGQPRVTPPSDRNAWARRLLTVAPIIPNPMLNFLASALADPRADSDALLWVADALEDASRHASLIGNAAQATQLHQLADLPRQLAPLRAWQHGSQATEPTCIGVDAAPGKDGVVEGIIERDGTVTLIGYGRDWPNNRLTGLPLRLRLRGPARSEPKARGGADETATPGAPARDTTSLSAGDPISSSGSPAVPNLRLYATAIPPTSEPKD